MRIGTPATARVERRARSSVATTCRARPTTRAAHHPARKAHVKRELQCYIPALIDNHRRSPRSTHTKINRQPRRLETSVTYTKQTPASQINRKHLRTLHPAFIAGLATSRKVTAPCLIGSWESLAELAFGNFYPEQTLIQRARICMKQNEKTFSNRYDCAIPAKIPLSRVSSSALHYPQFLPPFLPFPRFGAAFRA